MMDPDGFRFDSSVNYLGYPCTQMNSLGAKKAISLLLTEKSKVMLTLSFEYLRSCSCSQLPWDDWAAGPRWMRKRMTWMNRWTRDCKDKQSRLCQRWERVTQVGPEITIMVKRPKGTQWDTCLSKGPTFSRTQDGMSQTDDSGREKSVLNLWFFSFVFVFCFSFLGSEENNRENKGYEFYCLLYGSEEIGCLCLQSNWRDSWVCTHSHNG